MEEFDNTNQRKWTITDDNKISSFRTGDPTQGYLYFFTKDIRSQGIFRNFTSNTCATNNIEIPPDSIVNSKVNNEINDTLNETVNSSNTIDSEVIEMTIDTPKRYTCKVCKKDFGRIKRHLSAKNKKNCRKFYSTFELNELFQKVSEQQSEAHKAKKSEANKKSYDKVKESEAHKAKKSEANKMSYNKVKKSKANKMSYDKVKESEAHKAKKSETNKISYEKALKDLKNNPQQIFNNFMEKQSLGTLSYICVSCHRLLFKSGVAPFDGPKTEDMHKKIKEAELEYCVSTTDRFKCNEGRLWICYSCKGHLSKGKMPNMCHANGLAVSEMPQELQDLTYLELLMIKKKIVFLKVRDLKNSGMKQMKGKITNVPIQDEDVLKTAGVLPRMEDELGTVNVAFKYMRKGPYYRKAELIRPKKINEALRYLEKNHPSYFNFPIEYLKDPKKYKFVNLPLIGYFEEDQANLKNLDDAYSFLENSKLLTELLSPLLQRTQENYQNFMHQLVVNKSPRGPDSFIHALFDQMK